MESNLGGVCYSAVDPRNGLAFPHPLIRKAVWTASHRPLADMNTDVPENISLISHL